ncbi:MAG TPA: 50S ribosomal protein L4 [Stellaceae bacterium]|nr:50S ribosomal protein L4 [Stellaceae bacterium]
MQVDVYNTAGDVVGQTELNESVWGIEPNVAVMHQALLRQQANARLGTHQTKTRGEVRGGGKKPWRQKGTGRARQGSTRSPQWIGGGVVFGPHPRSYAQRMPRKMRRLAIRSALSAKLRDDRLTVIRGLGEIEPRTKTMAGVLARLPEARSVLIVMPERVETIARAAGNLPDVETIQAPYLNVRDVLKYERLLVVQEALPVIEGLWALENGQAVPVSEPAVEASPVGAPDVAQAAVAPQPGVATPGAVAGDGTPDCPAGYPIKGDAGSMLYHVPGGQYYNGTVPEMCFATEADAVAAGYHPQHAGGSAATPEEA